MKKMHRMLLGGMVIGLLVVGYPCMNLQAEETPEVIINEVAWAGSSVSSADEWIELKNTTPNNIDLTGWQVAGLTNNDSVVSLDINACLDANQNKITCVIQANGYFLIANNDKEHIFTNGTSVLNIDPDYVTSAINIASGNVALKISLYNGDWQGDGLLIDEAWDGSAPSCGSNSAKTSMERNATVAPGNLKDSWHEATEAINLDLDPEVFDKATPKSANSPEPIPAPTINSITPTETSAIDNFVLNQIDGSNFAMTGSEQIKLQNNSQAIWATDWQVISPVLIINIKFDLTDAEAGNWDMVVINPDQQSATLINALTILELDDTTGGSANINIQISEIYPRPTTGANDEFIELYNAGDNSVNLNGWQLDDQYPGGSAIYKIGTDMIITPDQYLVFSKVQTKISLNDSGDYVRLLNPQDVEIEITPNYGSANKGEAYAKFDGIWKWTLRPTPNAENLWDNPTPPDDTDWDDDPDSLEANEITIQMDADDITGTSVLLNWQISLIGAIGGLKLYQSDDKNYLGEMVAQPNVTQLELTITDLQPDTIYYFVLVGSYNADDIKSDQIKITTEKSGIVGIVLGDTSFYKQIIFTEILPNPGNGGEEFIELFNPTDQIINLTGWKLQDASGRTYIITAFDLPKLTIADSATSANVQLEPGQYLLLEYPVTHIRLNNSGGEELQLMDANDNLIDEVYYDGTAKPGYAYVIAPNQTWFWSDELTPGTENDISFATIDEDSGYYLVDTGKSLPWQILLWISLVISGIMVSYHVYHETNN
ncbi:MAG: lamin tail domain-containing protein [Patescibacteria group bacterium]